MESLTADSTLGRMPLAARQGVSVYDSIRGAIKECRWRGIEPRCVWVNQHTADKLHALWAFAADYDLVLPRVVEGVPFRVGMTGGQDVVFEYHDGATNEAARTTSKYGPH